MELSLSDYSCLGVHQFAIIDKFVANELVEQYPTIDIVSEHLKPQTHLYPALISIHELPSYQWKSISNEIAQQYLGQSTPRITLLLKSNLPTEVLHKELANVLIVSDEKQNYVLRYYDPRVLFQLSWMLTPWQLQTYLKTRMIPSWTFFLDNQWYTLHFKENVSYRKNDPIDLPFEKINRIGLINQILQQLPAPEDLNKKIRLSQQIDELLQNAAHCGLSDKQDMSIFVQQGIELQCAFWLHHDIQTVLNIATRSPKYYHRITSGWRTEHWQAIKSQTPALTFSNGI